MLSLYIASDAMENVPRGGGERHSGNYSFSSIDSSDSSNGMFDLSDYNDSLESWSSLKMMFWNVYGWSCGQVDVVKEVESMNMRLGVFNRFKPDIICVAETWLKGEDVARFDGHTWLSCNRRSLSRRAVRGSGGVGVFFRNVILNNWTVSMLDSETGLCLY